MAKNVKNTESKNNVVKNQASSTEKWLLNRVEKILAHPYINFEIADKMIVMITEWKETYKERELAKIDAEIARLTALKETL